MEFAIKNVFRDAFGYNPPKEFNVPKAGEKPVYSSLGQPYNATDALGREFFLPVTFEGAFQYGDLSQPFSYVVPFAVVGIDEKKTIVSTPMPERGGSVKELISIDDYSISIKGILISNDNSFPEDQIKMLQNIFLINQSLTLRSVVTDIFLNGVFEHRVVIKDIKWPAVAGVEHARPFEMNCESDMIFTLDV